MVALQKEVQTSYNEAVKSDAKTCQYGGWNTSKCHGKMERNDCKQYRNQTTETESQTQENPDHRDKETGRNSKKEETQKTEETQTTESTEKKEDTQKSDSKKSTGTVKTKDICNVRKSPSTDGELLGKVDIGVELKKLGTEGDWTKVKFQGETGYVKSEICKGSVFQVRFRQGNREKRRISAMCVKTASTDGELLGKVDAGVKLKKLGTKGEWTKVKFQGKNRIHQERFIKNGKIIKTS